MEFIFLLVLLAVFLLPSFFMMRKQNQRQKEMAAMQAGLQPGNRVVTGAGLHGTVHQVRETEIDLEVAPGTVVTVERQAILRHAEPPAPIADPQTPAAGLAEGDSATGETYGQWSDSQFPEGNRPEDGDNPHPENLR
ncbi:MAG: preprotein translocase subunit YajC [Corynebacterium sp.]|uniref:preprotein translocase subunit YajC n=1 Tax=Corynebacterium sp. TaxID=1720 RepID=UPI0026F657CD|nr:preprotein translocase subunit YajC [Corynebacterium sp.]